MGDVQITLSPDDAALLWRCVRAGRSALSAGDAIQGRTAFDADHQALQRAFYRLDDLFMQATYHATNPGEPIPDGMPLREAADEGHRIVHSVGTGTIACSCGRTFHSERPAVMRERAQAASDGPWHTDFCIQHGSPFVCNDDGMALIGDFRDAVPNEPDVDAEHVASWHPAVALAVADWLDEEADGGRWGLVSSTAIAVARAYLGEGE